MPILLDTGPSAQRRQRRHARRRTGEKVQGRQQRLNDLAWSVIGTGAYTRGQVARAVVRAWRKLAQAKVPAGACRLPLTQGQWALVDAADFDALAHDTWCFADNGRTVYAQRGRDCADLSNVVLPPRRGCVVDHVSGDRLDNRRRNLRHATYSQNGANAGKRTGGTSRFKGVYRRAAAKTNPWVAVIKINYRTVYLGRFATEEAAARTYDRAARKAWGRFARTNFGGGNAHSA